MMGLGAYGPLSGLNDTSTVIGSLPHGPLETAPNIFNQLSLPLENLPHSSECVARMRAESNRV